MKCDECESKGYIVKAGDIGNGLQNLKIWCENCKGTGQVKYGGDRSGLEWERE